MGNSYMDWEEKGKGFFSRPAFPGRSYARHRGCGTRLRAPPRLRDALTRAKDAKGGFDLGMRNAEFGIGREVVDLDNFHQLFTRLQGVDRIRPSPGKPLRQDAVRGVA